MSQSRSIDSQGAAILWPWRLAEHAHATRHGDDVVLLDVRDASYVVLPDAEAVLRLEGASNGVRIADDDLAAQLAAAGFVLRAVADAPPEPRRALPTPARNLKGDASVVPTIGEIVTLAWVGVEMIWLFRLRPFSRLVRAAAAGGAPGADVPTEASAPAAARMREDLIRRVQVFDRLLPWVPWQGQCLFRSAMLRRILQRAGHDVAWVFGVRTWPFGAHCWLQAGDLVLNDRVERVMGFSPVMIV